jgi:hypothetical protein
MNGDHHSKNRDRGGRYPQKLSDDEVVEVRAMLGAGISGNQIARQFGCSAAMVSRIKSGKRRSAAGKPQGE